MNWWVASAFRDGGAALVVAWAGWVIISICLHELAHGWVAIWQGDRTPIETGHMTWNPIVHMGVPSLLIFALAGIAWGAMPVNPRRMRHRYSDVLVSLAGPLMNFLLALICIVLGGVCLAFGRLSDDGANMFDFASQPWPMRMMIFFLVGGALNVALGLFNLLPAPPLDGSRILGGLIPAYRRFITSGPGNVASLILFMLAFFFGGRLVFGIGVTTVTVGIGIIGGLLNLVGLGPD